jgi:hypothetical protein
MRHGGTTKQRLRVGSSRYCGGCWHAGAHANCLADSRLKRYSVRRDFTNTHSDCDACIANAHSYRYANTYLTNANRNSHIYSFGDADSASRTKVAANTASSADAAVKS